MMMIVVAAAAVLVLAGQPNCKMMNVWIIQKFGSKNDMVNFPHEM